MNNRNFICPKGKNFLNEYESGSFTEIKAFDYALDKDWEFSLVNLSLILNF